MRSGPPPWKITTIGFLINTGLNSVENHKATKPSFNVRPLSARQRNAYDGPVFVVFRSASPSLTKKKRKKREKTRENVISVGLPLKLFSGSARDLQRH